MILMCSILAFESCSKFLDKPAHNMTPEVELNDIATLSSSIYSSFIKMPSGSGHAIMAMGELASDNLLRGSNMNDAGGSDPEKLWNQFQNFAGISPTSNNCIEPIWNGLYPLVEQANINIRAINRLFPDEEETKKNAFIAENRCMRAYFYMFLCNTFGNVIIVPEESLTPKEYAQLTNDKSIPQIYEYIVNDLRFAVDNIPSKEDWTNLYQLPWQGRCHLGTAQGLLAKALLFQAANALYFKVENAEEIAANNYKEIMGIVEQMHGSFSLFPDYEAMFRAEGNFCYESLLEIGTASTPDGTTCFKGFRPVQPRGFTGYGFSGPTMNLINQYEKDSEGNVVDKRYFGTVLFGATSPWSGMEHPDETSPFRTMYDFLMVGNIQTDNQFKSGWPNRWCRKLVQSKPTSTAVGQSPENFGGNNLKLLRWGEVLLCGAEAAYYAGDEAKAKDWVKEIRTRAGLDNASVDGLTGQDLLELIWKEKRIETATEWSKRYFEMVRIDKINPGYMFKCMEAKVEDEFKAIVNHLDETDGWAGVYHTQFPITKDNYRELIPLKNGVQIPRHYTMPISTKTLQKMPNLKQTEYYR